MFLARIGRIASLTGGIDRQVERRTVRGVVNFDNDIVGNGKRGRVTFPDDLPIRWSIKCCRVLAPVAGKGMRGSPVSSRLCCLCSGRSGAIRSVACRCSVVPATGSYGDYGDDYDQGGERTPADCKKLAPPSLLWRWGLFLPFPPPCLFILVIILLFFFFHLLVPP